MILYCDNPQYFKLTTEQKIYDAVKRIIDFVFAVLLFALNLIPSLIIAVSIKIDSRGPVFFKQDRIGKDGKVFKLWKFRSMSVEANHNIAGYQYAEVEKNITKVGSFLRRTSLDEIPQLWNILKGDMSFIGYRPAQPNEDELNIAREPYGLYQLRPGITGWAQVNGRDILAANPPLKAKYDGYYLQHFSLKTDIVIILKTVKDVVMHKDIHEGILDNDQKQ